jgi:dTDP-4-dehydrorhamnose reductase
MGKRTVAVTPIGAAQYKTVAKRPLNGTLNCSKFEETFSLHLPAWQDGLRACADLCNNKISE